MLAVLEEAVYISGRKSAREGGNSHGIVCPMENGGEQGAEEQEAVKKRLLTGYVSEYIESHYMEDISLQDVAGQFNYSDAYFCRFFKQNFDKNFIMYLSEIRINKARELLSDITVNVKDIGQRVGYRDSSYFTKVFKRVTGMTPSEYRYRYGNTDDGVGR